MYAETMWGTFRRNVVDPEQDEEAVADPTQAAPPTFEDRVFEDRAEAGRLLADRLAELSEVTAAERLVVLAIPRGGLPVAAEVAGRLEADLDVVVVRKLRSPHNPELGFGAVGLDGEVHLDQELVERLGISEEQVAREVADRKEVVAARVGTYREVAPLVELEGAVVIVVDDGIATGGTALEACRYARRRGAAAVVLAAPVAPRELPQDLVESVDVTLVLAQPPEFMAVGQAYRSFPDLDDESVMDGLRRALA
jgi:predicted phosphoribosyltransferase